MRFGPDVDQLDVAGAMVIALQRATAARRRADRADIDNIRVFGVNGDIAAFARAGDVTITPANNRPRWCCWAR